MFSLTLGSSTQEGKFGGYSDIGDFIFGVNVFIANIRVLLAVYQINVGILVIVAWSCGLYLAAAAIISNGEIF